MKVKVRVLFVCMGNICRSPMGQGVFERLVREAGLESDVFVDSAGTHAYHIGHPPDTRAQSAAESRGYDIRSQRARQAGDFDISAFDYIVAMDSDNLQHLREMSPPGEEGKIRLLLDFGDGRPGREVPDPYYGGRSGFERVLDLVEQGSRGLLEYIRDRHRL
ncbi:MAG: low molecular weight phosphotyrosine protein phosphatase [Gammaproteobacteria bacterium]|jgi:protein-tyrosine phosphatase|nr:low molecular weight phosphotyrosine protein phosphatase [Gammaproteobacteria bacterium]